MRSPNLFPYLLYRRLRNDSCVHCAVSATSPSPPWRSITLRTAKAVAGVRAAAAAAVVAVVTWWRWMSIRKSSLKPRVNPPPNRATTILTRSTRAFSRLTDLHRYVFLFSFRNFANVLYFDERCLSLVRVLTFPLGKRCGWLFLSAFAQTGIHLFNETVLSHSFHVQPVTSATTPSHGPTTAIVGPDGKERSFVCVYCRKAFSQKHHLDQHMTLHTGRRLYACPTCGRKVSFYRRNNKNL